jgi:two-component system cell cycle response regulator
MAPRTARDAAARAHVLCVTAADEIAERLTDLAEADGLRVHRAHALDEALEQAGTHSYTVVVLGVDLLDDARVPRLRHQLPQATHVALATDSSRDIPVETPAQSIVRVGRHTPPQQLRDALGRAQLLAEERRLTALSLRAEPSEVPEENRILLLEDNPGDALLLEEHARNARFDNLRIVRASRLEAALQLLLTESFALVLADLSLPDARGLDVVVALRSAAPSVPLVVLTGASDDALALQTLQQGAQDVLYKAELGPDTLRRAVRTAVERRAQEEQLEHRASLDPLTQLLNRASFAEHLEASIERAHLASNKLALLFLDLNGFKQINDTLGHATGDTVLRIVADRLRGCARDSDALARLGGDEFAMVSEELRSVPDAMAIAARVVETLREPVRVGERSIAVGASVGVALYPEDGADASTLLRHADEAMYRAKRGSRDGFVCHGERQALTRQDFRLARHWLLGLRDGATLGWVMAPDRSLESAGVAEAASRMTLAAASELARLTSEPLLVRVTPVLLRDQALQTCLLEPERASVELIVGQDEVTTAHVRHDFEQALEAGLRLWLGDYGRKDVDLKLLSALPGLRGVLLDIGWCRELASDAAGLSLLRAFTSAADTLGMLVVAPACELSTTWFLSAGCHAVLSSVALHVETDAL